MLFATCCRILSKQFKNFMMIKIPVTNCFIQLLSLFFRFLLDVEKWDAWRRSGTAIGLCPCSTKDVWVKNVYRNKWGYQRLRIGWCQVAGLEPLSLTQSLKRQFFGPHAKLECSVRFYSGLSADHNPSMVRGCSGQTYLWLRKAIFKDRYSYQKTHLVTW